MLLFRNLGKFPQNGTLTSVTQTGYFPVLYPYRELVGLDQTLQTWDGEYNNNLVKLLELNGQISETERDLEQISSEDEKTQLTRRLEKLKEARAPRLELANRQREELCTQINRIRETIDRVLNEDKKMAELLRTLFREQSTPIACILTALGMAISIP